MVKGHNCSKSSKKHEQKDKMVISWDFMVISWEIKWILREIHGIY